MKHIVKHAGAAMQPGAFCASATRLERMLLTHPSRPVVTRDGQYPFDVPLTRQQVRIKPTLTLCPFTATFVCLTQATCTLCRSLDSVTSFLQHVNSAPCSSLSFFWTRNERAPGGVMSEATQHCCENNCHNIHYHDQAKQTVKKDIWWHANCRAREQNQTGREDGTNLMQLFRLKASYLCACQTHHWGRRGTSTSVPSVSKTPVHHRRSTQIHRRHRRHQTTHSAIDAIDAIEATKPPPAPSTPSKPSHRRH